MRLFLFHRDCNSDLFSLFGLGFKVAWPTVFICCLFAIFGLILFRVFTNGISFNRSNSSQATWCAIQSRTEAMAKVHLNKLSRFISREA